MRYLQGQPNDLSEERRFRLVLALLRRHFPPQYPVKVRRIKNPRVNKEPVHGVCSLVNEDAPRDKRYFLILIDKESSWEEQFTTLTHEWAHALVWNKGVKHHDAWGRAYSRIYRFMIEE